MTFIKEPDGLPVKIRFDETSQFAEGSANVSATTFLSSLQKLPKIGRPRGYQSLSGKTDKSETTRHIMNH